MKKFKNDQQPLLARCVIATKNPLAGHLLYRICYWHSKASEKQDGKRWIAKTAAEWQWETGLSAGQYNRALARLKQAGLISTKQAKFAGDTITHLLLTQAGTSLLQYDSIPLKTAKIIKNGKAEFVGTGKPHIQGDTGKEIPTQNLSSEIVPISPAVKGSLGKKIDAGEEMNSPPEVLPLPPKAPLPQTPADLAGLPDNASGLAKLWTSLVPALHEIHVALTNKEFGQLKQIHNKCPPGEALQVVEFAIRKWFEFGLTAQQETGVVIPAKPYVGPLLKCISVAVTMANMAHVQPPPKSPPEPPATTKPQPKKSKKSDAATLDEVKAILGWSAPAKPSTGVDGGKGKST